MAENTLFKRLEKIFSTDVVIRNKGGDQLKVIDVNTIQRVGKTTNQYIDRYNRIYSRNTTSLYGQQLNLNYKYIRPRLYSEYDLMDGDAIIASALDIIAEECTLKNETGDVLRINTSNDDIKKVLYNLHYDILNIEFNLWSWIRQMCKFGDFFLKLHISDQYGVYNVTPYSAYYIERVETDLDKDGNPHLEVKFVYHPEGVLAPQDTMYYNVESTETRPTWENFEVAHFRLTTDINYAPYGRCLVPNTRIYTENGIEEIKNIKKDDKVWTYNIEKNQYELATVLNTINSGIKNIYNVKTKHNEIKGSDNHPILVWDFDENKPNYKQIKELTTNDLVCVNKEIDIKYQNLKLNNSLPEYVTSEFKINNEYNVDLYKILSITEELPEETYDIQVDKNSNFIANGIIVHNSFIEPARKLYKQYTMMEEAMLIHRIVRSADKRIFYINVGSIPPNEVETFMQKIVNNMKRSPHIDPQTGEYNLRYNLQNLMEDYYIPVRGGDSTTKVDNIPGLNYTGIEDVEYLREKLFAALKIPKAFLGYEKDLEGKCIDPLTKIPLLDGRTLTAKEIISEFEQGIKNYTYSINEETQEIIPGEIEWAGYTRLNTETVKVWLDNNEYIRTTPDHRFMLRDGSWVEAQYLNEGDSLMPLSPTNPEIILLSKIEWCDELIDTCDISIKEHHNFGTDAGIIIHNSTLAAQDIRFARTIDRIQRIVLSELYKISLIHLYAQGFRDEDLTNFELNLTSPSIIFEQEKIALLKDKADLATSILNNKLLPSEYVYANIFNLSEKEYEEYRDLTLEDAKHKFRINQIENEGNDPYITGKSYGTPHDLATSYGKGRMDSNPSNIPDGYNGDIKLGRPQEKVTRRNTQQDPLGKDRLGVDGMKYDDNESDSIRPQYKGGSPLALENYIRSKENSLKKTLLTENKEDISFLDEKNLSND